MKRIVTVQDISCVGKCSLTVALPIISAMGTGNKLYPSRFEITDIYKTSICPLAKVMRKELRKRNIDSLKVIYSKEEPIEIDEYSNSSYKTNCICPPGTKRKCTIRNQVPGSISFVPSVAGLMIACAVSNIQSGRIGAGLVYINKNNFIGNHFNHKGKANRFANVTCADNSNFLFRGYKLHLFYSFCSAYRIF